MAHRPLPRGPLLRTVGLMAASTAWGAVVSAREDVVGEPLLLRAPGSVRTHLVTGWGTGLSAPWPMVAVALVDALRERSGRTAGRWCELVGAAMVVGTLIEPVTWGRRGRSPLIASAVVSNLAVATLMIRAGRRAQER